MRMSAPLVNIANTSKHRPAYSCDYNQLELLPVITCDYSQMVLLSCNLYKYWPGNLLRWLA